MLIEIHAGDAGAYHSLLCCDIVIYSFSIV